MVHGHAELTLDELAAWAANLDRTDEAGWVAAGGVIR
jgi:hypothetical protein